MQNVLILLNLIHFQALELHVCILAIWVSDWCGERLPHVASVSHRCFLVSHINTLRPRRNEQHFADDIFKRIFFNEKVWIPIKISLKFVPQGPIDNIPALFQIMAWRRPGDKPLSGPMMVRLPTHICVTRPQWVKRLSQGVLAFMKFLKQLKCHSDASKVHQICFVVYGLRSNLTASVKPVCAYGERNNCKYPMMLGLNVFNYKAWIGYCNVQPYRTSRNNRTYL